jgi:toxin YoeB
MRVRRPLRRSINSGENSDLSAKTNRAAVFEPEFREDLRFWIESDSKIALRIMTLAEDVMRSPFIGLGKPEPLKYELAGAWSRRITREHRLVYRVYADRIAFPMARYHYRG